MKFHIHAEVEQADGYTTFEIDAEDEAQAIELFNAGEGKFIGEEINVTSYISVSVDDVEEIGTWEE